MQRRRQLASQKELVRAAAGVLDATARLARYVAGQPCSAVGLKLQGVLFIAKSNAYCTSVSTVACSREVVSCSFTCDRSFNVIEVVRAVACVSEMAQLLSHMQAGPSTESPPQPAASEGPKPATLSAAEAAAAQAAATMASRPRTAAPGAMFMKKGLRDAFSRAGIDVEKRTPAAKPRPPAEPP